jgi:hypothetical protein
MITLTQKIVDIMNDPLDDGEALNDIVDEYRIGKDPDEVIELLDSDNSDLVGLGAWILSEIDEEKYNSEPFISRLMNLTNHEDPTVRFNSIGALYPCLDWTSESTKELYEHLSKDSDKGVSTRAKMGMERAKARGEQNQ